ncbi:MAG: hypothetical protein R2867_00465 [Caldilineaceae bacterium]
MHEGEGKIDYAVAAFQSGIQLAQTNQDKFIEAYLQRVLGTLWRRQGKEQQGRDSLKAAMELFKEMGLDHEVATTKNLLDG